MAIEKQINITVDTSKATTNVKTLNTEIQNTNNEAKKTGEGLKGFVGVADQATGGLISKFGSLTGTLGKVAVAFRGVGAAIAATGIGLLVVVVASLISSFKTSEEGQNRFAKLMGVIGSVVGNVTDVLSRLGDLIIGIFSGDSEAIKKAKEFGKAYYDAVGLPIKTVIELVKTAGNVLKNLFSGDVKGAIDALKDGVNGVKKNFQDASKAITSAKNAITEFGKEALKEAQIAAQIADLRANADKQERELIVERALADRKRAELLEKAQQRQNFTLQERIKFLKEASKIEEDITKKEIDAAKKRRDAIIEENKLSDSNKDALKEEEELKAKVIELETNRLKKQKEVTSQISGLIEQEKALNKAAYDEKKRQQDEEQKRLDEIIKKEQEAEKARLESIQKLQEDYAKRLEDMEADNELKKLDLERERAFAELERLEATELQKLEAKEYYQRREDELLESLAKQAREKRQKADEEAAQLEIKTRQALEDAKYGISSQGLDLIGSLANKSKGIATALLLVEKGLAISQIITNASRAIAQANANLAATPAVIGVLPNPMYAVQAAATAQGIATTKISAGLSIANILAQTVTKLGNASSVGGSSSGGGVGAPQAPSFNLVSGTGTNQIAESLATERQPVKAYVVASEMTSQQALENNISSTASIG